MHSFYSVLELWFHPTIFAYLMAGQYFMLAIWQIIRGEWGWGGMWFCYGLANIFVGAKQ